MLGDRVRIGSVLLEVAQAASLCWKLNLRFGHKDMARRLQDTGRTGWYWRVLEPGHLQAGDAIHLIARPHPEWTLARVARDLLYHRPLDREALQGLARLPLPPSWQRIVQGRLERGQVEDWTDACRGNAQGQSAVLPFHAYATPHDLVHPSARPSAWPAQAPRLAWRHLTRQRGQKTPADPRVCCRFTWVTKGRHRPSPPRLHNSA